MRALKPNSVLLQSQPSDKQVSTNESSSWRLFTDPLDIIATSDVEQVNACLSRIDDYTAQGYYAVGYCSYEAAAGINTVFQVAGQHDIPLLWFGIYADSQSFDFASSQGAIVLESRVLESRVLESRVLENRRLAKHGLANRGLSKHGDKPLNSPLDWQPSISQTQYLDDVQRIRERIAAGDTYQVNHTFRLYRHCADEPLAFFYRMCQAQQSAHSAYLHITDTHHTSWHICSASPELFFHYHDQHITTKPMKGTATRHGDAEDDAQQKTWLAGSTKNHAENIMIVDMLRSDIGQLAVPGTVNVERLCDIEIYPTVFQMTSTISATLPSDIAAVDVFKSLFPCASVTGAPKVKTMSIIAATEQSPRGVYTGSIGYFGPNNNAQFNVAIRTAVINSAAQTVEYGVGSGVIWDSDPQEEYAECLAKAAILP